jgi:glycosyltransferase involved in cell wall biosynthesis
MTALNQPHFSIITVVRNAESDVGKTITSVIDQNFLDLEHIVIDGNSTDQTVNVIRSIGSKYVKLWSEDDLGLYDAMNKGIKKANGKFVFFLNAGDTFASDNVLQYFYKKMTDADLIYFGYTRIVAGKYSWTSFENGMPDINKFLLPHHQSIFYPKSFTEKNIYNIKYKVQSDIDYTIRSINQKSYRFIDLCTAVSNLGGYSVTVLRGYKSFIKLSQEIIEIRLSNTPGLNKLNLSLTFFKYFIKCASYNMFGINALFYLMNRRKH